MRTPRSTVVRDNGRSPRATASTALDGDQYDGFEISSSSSSSSSSSTLATALATLKSDIQTIELASDTTVGQLAAIATAFETLKTDGLTPTSQSALESFENSLVTDFRLGDDLDRQRDAAESIRGALHELADDAGNDRPHDGVQCARGGGDFLEYHVGGHHAINTDWSAVLAAEGSTSTATFPYFQLVTGQAGRDQGRGHGRRWLLSELLSDRTRRSSCRRVGLARPADPGVRPRPCGTICRVVPGELARVAHAGSAPIILMSDSTATDT